MNTMGYIEMAAFMTIEEILPSLVTEEMLSIVTEQIRVIALEQIEMAKQYFKPADHHE